MVTPFPTRAFVLAAGFGTRMRPLSYDVPKPLMPVWNKPALQRILELLRDWGVREVLINLHHGADSLFAFARSNPVPGLRIALSFEPEILGTGGALRRAEWFVRQGPLWLINSDIVAQLDPEPLRYAFRRGRCLAALWLHPARGPRTVEMRNGWIRSFEAAHPGAPHTYTFCGLHLLSPRILNWLPRETRFAGIIEAYQRAMTRGERIAGVAVDHALWFDIGSPFQYLETHRALFPIIGKPFVAAAPTARISPRARVENAVVWEGAVLRAGAHVRNAIVGRHAVVRSRAPYIALQASKALGPDELEELRCLGFDALRSTALFLEPRPSARTFIRLEDDRRSVMLMRYDPARAENALYAEHAKFLAGLGLRVPRIWLHKPEACRVWIEDLGSLSVQEIWPSLSAHDQAALYKRVIAAVARWHGLGAQRARAKGLRLMPPLNAQLYRWERNYFAEHFLRRYAHCSEKAVRAAMRDLSRAAGKLAREPRALIHRDLQSSNILVKSGQPVFIDFQGMRYGPAAYDLASLLCDPYLNLEEPQQMALLQFYNQTARRPVGAAVFWAAACERLAQALGAYARLGCDLKLPHFLGYIPAALDQLDRALEKADWPERRQWFPECRAAVKHIAPAP
jgi:NDP-sugar pyrophosphorylase family protein/aminoglycoside/choline kinase family phosphotransferase